jgi:oxygen-independent coproporphyrinogen III oxidase
MKEPGKQINSQTSGLYVHIPFCVSKCAYCSFYSEPLDGHEVHRTMQAILKELSHADTHSVRTVYIGGGSPSCLPASELCHLIEAIKDRCSDICEFTVEGNPGQITAGMLKSLHDMDVNRLSIGAQSFNPEELQCLGRKHSTETISNAMCMAREAGFNNISLDLIFAICNSTQAAWQRSLDEAIALNPEHISAYSLSLETGTPLAESCALGRYQVVDEAADRAMYEQAIDTLIQAGYEHYEISNFAKAGYKCRHNMGYWQNRPYIGIGPSAASSSGKCRTKNVSDIRAYVNAIESGQSPADESILISPMEQICETAVLNLRTRDGIDIQRFKQDTGYDPRLLFEEPIKIHNKQGLLIIEKNRIFLAQEALPIADYVLCDFASL